MSNTQQAPDFSLPDQDGKAHSLSEYQGKWLILYFYPQDETPGCTEEACVFRDGRKDLDEAGAEVVGISIDSVASHKAFAEHHGLNFTLLSDETAETVKAYNAWGTRTNKDGQEITGTLRQTFLIDPEGNITKTYEEVSPATHAAQILEDLRTERATRD